MKQQDHNKAWGFTLYGDDLRLEVGNKVSLMGMYQADMVFPPNVQLPIHLPKLVILIMYYEKFGAIESDFKFVVTFGDDNQLIAEAPVLRSNFPQSPNPQEQREDSERLFAIVTPIVVAPFQLEKMGRIRVRAHYEDGSELRLGTFHLRHATEEEFLVAFQQPHPANPPPA